MSSTVKTVRQQSRFSDWLRPQLRWITLPSWVVSTGLHVGLLFLLIYLAQLRSCRHDIQGDGGDSWRQVGIVTREQNPPSESTTADTADSENTETVDQSPQSDPIAASNPVEQVPTSPPIELPALPGMSEPIVGVGQAPGITLPNVDSLVNGGQRSGSPSAPASSGDSDGLIFFGGPVVGSRFVYVIDKSWSMANDNALRFAKTELTRSLQRLDESQQFQIIFYNTEGVEVMRPRDNRFDLFWGTDSQRLAAANQFEAVQAHGGTDHYPALQAALKFNPDVVFFLTDGKEPPLSAPDLASIRTMNRGAGIHCIEFGKERRSADPSIDPDNWLRQLARENSGTYVYRNVHELTGRER